MDNNKLQTVAIEHFPQSIRDIVEVIGITATIALVDARGGTPIWIPEEARQDHWLAPIVGMHALERLVAIYGREPLELPRCEGALRTAREQQIMAEAEAGATNVGLALKHGYTTRGMRKLRRRVEVAEDDRQGDLF